MTNSYYANFVLLPTVITKTGKYQTRNGETVLIRSVSDRHNHSCIGTYSNGVEDGWHKSGRIYYSLESSNDIVKFLED